MASVGFDETPSRLRDNKKQFMRSLSTAYVGLRTFRRMQSTGNALDLNQTAVVSVDEFEHLKIRDVRQFLLGIAFTVSIAVCSGMLNNVAKNTSRPGFHGPCFLLWFRAMFRMLTFPAYMVLRAIFEVLKQRKTTGMGDALKRDFRDAVNIYGDPETRPSFGKFCVDLLVLTIFTVASQYMTFAPLFAGLSIGNVAALGATSIVFVFIFSTYFLRIQIKAAKVFGVVLALCGTAVLIFVEITTNARWRNSLLVIGGSFSTSIYQILFKRRVGGTTNLGRISFFTTLLATVTVIFIWPLVLLLRLLDVEQWKFEKLPWEMIGRTSAAAWALVFLINLGVSLANPMFTSLGFLLTVFVTYIFDRFWNNRFALPLDIVSALLIGAGFALLVFSDVLTKEALVKEWHSLCESMKVFRKFAGKSLDSKIEKKLNLHEDRASSLRVLGRHITKRGSIPVAIPEWSTSGQFRALDA